MSHTDATTALPPLEGVSRRKYRCYGIEHVPFDTYPDYWDGGPSIVVRDGWGVSYRSGGGIQGYELRAYRVPFPGAKHELHGTRYADQRSATRAAYEAGLLAFLVYEESTDQL
jgi:hypothetical protein